ncbi:MAG: pilus assembly protein PilM [Patescibacteria group bacterium]|nr:pilus assembly protein PilM [Patescibacteria group bacterium]
MFKKIDYSNSFGIQIEDNAIRLVEIRQGGSGLKITGFFKKSLEPDVVDRGAVKKKKTLARIINQGLAHCTPSSIKKKKVICSVPEYKSFVKIIEIPFMEAEEAEEAIKWETEENIPLPLKKVYYDWKIIASSQEENKMQIMLVAAPRDVIDSRIETFELCGLLPVGFVPDSFGLNKCLAMNGQDRKNVNSKTAQSNKVQLAEKEQLATVIYFGDEKSIVFIRKGSVILFSSSILFNASQFLKEIVKQLALKNHGESKPVNQDIALEKIKKNGFGNQYQKEVYYQTAQTVIKELMREIKNALNYFEKKEEIEIPSIYLTGAGSSLKGIDEFFSAELSRTIEQDKELVGYRIAGKSLAIPKNFICDYSIVLGSALG